MSDIQTESRTPGADIPGFSCTTVPNGMNGETGYRVTFGTRSLSLRVLGLADQWDLLELATSGAEASSWMTVASIAAAVYDVDGTPIPRMQSATEMIRQSIRRVLSLLGHDGLNAAAAGLAIASTGAAISTTDGMMAAAKN